MSHRESCLRSCFCACLLNNLIKFTDGGLVATNLTRTPIAELVGTIQSCTPGVCVIALTVWSDKHFAARYASHSMNLNNLVETTNFLGTC